MLQKVLELEHLDGRRNTMQYGFYAQMRDNRMILLCEWDNMEFFERLMDQFEESDNIARFIISYDNKIVNDKWLKPKGKGRCLKK